MEDMEKKTTEQPKADPDDVGSFQILSNWHSHITCSSKPSWLLSTLADLDERIRILGVNAQEEEEADTFAQRAESYYRKRPQLLTLLQDLHNAYLSLANRFPQSLSRHHHHHPHIYDTDSHFETTGDARVDSDAESAISYQPQSSSSNYHLEIVSEHSNLDSIITKLVIKSVEYELMVHELSMRDRKFMEAWRKVELQKSLLEVLESERMILLNENAKLEYKVAALVEENKGLAAESVFMKRKTGELARCVLKMRDDHRVCLLCRKIEDLQGQIYGLEKRNKEYYDQLVSRRNQRPCLSCKEGEKGDSEGKHACGGYSGDGGSSSGRSGSKGGGASVRILKWWEHFKKYDFALCGPRSDAVGP
ncbi:hypothetical protein Nepgr_015966 [Nepenthes gracilis]|uniref:NAB domain-containing protein n=1 Tax=Nepenthes gracilis TaxID=150966 RepID=A0AAD3SNS5_NEPGR|nr:hypothetical protein Nepgr_015966 [Nepenthes gracilis]